jgi:hypothetical protein
VKFYVPSYQDAEGGGFSYGVSGFLHFYILRVKDYINETPLEIPKLYIDVRKSRWPVPAYVFAESSFHAGEAAGAGAAEAKSVAA